MAVAKACATKTSTACSAGSSPRNNRWTLKPVTAASNIFAGDTIPTAAAISVNSLTGKETSVLQRSTFSATHNGSFDWGRTRYAEPRPDPQRLPERRAWLATAKGLPESAGRFESRLRNTRATGEVNCC